MYLRELSVPGAWEITPHFHYDDRGHFHEAFTEKAFHEMAGHRFSLRQMNVSVSSEGVVRGLHYAAVPPGQAKYVMCTSGAVFDVVVDIRTGSPTFGEWAGVMLDAEEGTKVYVPEGVAHGFVALDPESAVMYLCSEPWRPDSEFAIDPFDPELAIDWPSMARDGTVLDYRMSDKDSAAPSLDEARAAGRLPSWEDCEAYVESLRD